MTLLLWALIGLFVYVYVCVLYLKEEAYNIQYFKHLAKNSFSFSGKARPAEFIIFRIFSIVATLFLSFLLNGGYYFSVFALSIALSYVDIAAAARKLRDIGFSLWLCVLFIVPVLKNIQPFNYIFVFVCIPFTLLLMFLPSKNACKEIEPDEQND